MHKATLLLVLFALCAVSSVASLKLTASKGVDRDLFELEEELSDIVQEVQKRRALEEFPLIFAKYNANCEFNIQSSLCSVEGYGRNFAICVGNEEHDIERDEIIAKVVDVVMIAATGPIYEAALAAGHAAQGDFAKAADKGLSAVLTAVGDPTAVIRSIVTHVAGEMDTSYFVCTTCAVAMAWALKNKRASKDIGSVAKQLASAFNYPFEYKEKSGTRILCPLSADLRDELARLEAVSPESDAEAQALATKVLALLVRSQIDAIRVRSGVQVAAQFVSSPFQTIFNAPLKIAEESLNNVLEPSTERITPKKKGGWLVEDLTDDYFDDGNDPLQFFKPTILKYRDCQRICGGGACDVRGCSRECGCVIA